MAALSLIEKARLFFERKSLSQQLALIWEALSGGGSGIGGKVDQGPIIDITDITGLPEAIPDRPSVTDGFRFYLEGTGSTVQFVIAPIGTLDGDLPAFNLTHTSTVSDGFQIFDEPCGPTETFYILSATGGVAGRWIKL